MTPQEVNKQITDVINTLCTVSVSGKENMDHMLGCIWLLEKLRPEIAAFEQPVKEVSDHDDNNAE